MSIDYGMGQTNIDKDTGIRYGVISTNSLFEGFWDKVDYDYGPPTCPKCGNAADVVDESDLTDEEREEEYSCKPRSCPDFACKSCKYIFGSEDAYSEKALGWSIGNSPILPDGSPNPNPSDLFAVDCLDSDCMVIRSRYYTYARFCSPCVPGGGNLDSLPGFAWDCEASNSGGGFVTTLRPDGGVPTYCLDQHWFEEGNCPYPIWRVSDDALVYVPPHLRSITLRLPSDLEQGGEGIELISGPVEPLGEEQDSAEEGGEDQPCPDPAPSGTCQIALEFLTQTQADSLLDWLHAHGVDGSFDRLTQGSSDFDSLSFRLRISRIEGHNETYRWTGREFRRQINAANEVTHCPLLTVGETEDLLDKRQAPSPD